MEEQKIKSYETGTPDAILEIRNLTKHYPDFTLDHINLTLPSGCIMGVMGENGAGKSTAIKAVLGLIHPDEGEIKMFGSPLSEANPSLKEKLGLVLDGLNLPAAMNAGQAGRMMAGLYKSWDASRYTEYLTRFSINPQKKIQDYSRGMRMKLSLAIALSHRARLLILDEPTSGLDPMIREEILDILREFILDEDCSVLISSHIISDLEKTADYAAFLHKGKLVLCEEKDRLLEEYRILKGSREELQRLDEKLTFTIVGTRENSFGAEALIHLTGRPDGNYTGFGRELGETVTIEQPSLEQILLYLASERS